MEMQTDSVEPEKRDFLEPLQTGMSKAFDVVNFCIIIFYCEISIK